MPILDLFSRRQRQVRGEFPDVYQYKTLPNELRVQIVHLMTDTAGEIQGLAGTIATILITVHDSLVREYGWFRLDAAQDGPVNGVVTFLLKTPDTEKALDVVELFFRIAERLAHDSGSKYPLTNGRVLVKDAIEELNARFREHGVGYAFEAGDIVRIDSQLLHTEVVRPALRLLNAPGYSAAEAEFLSAHEHYRHRRFAECINEALKAFESVMKIICTKRRWPHKSTDTANRLIEVCVHNGLVPAPLLNHFSSVRAALESGVPVVRNRLTGHGQGTQPVTVPESLASYILHLAAANILFLVRAEAELP